MDRIEPTGLIGADVPRLDGVAKVTGAVRYGADQPVGNVAYAYLATSTIAVGRISFIDEIDARAVDGVLDILTCRNVGDAVGPGRSLLDHGYMASTVAPLASERIWFAGQIVAVVIAETFEAARAASFRLAIGYETRPPSATLDSPGAVQVDARATAETALETGDFEAAYEAAPVTVDAWYETPPQHHNPMELFQTTCAWDGEALTVWESTQSVRGTQHGIAEQLGIKPAQVRVISPYVGGAFGSRGQVSQSTALVALAAKRLGRPVKLVATRSQGFTLRTFRAETRHHVKLAAGWDGRLQAMWHEGWELTSRSDRFALSGIDVTARLYACPNIVARAYNVEADRQSPGFMRAPPETPYMFALESALDELAYKLAIDPVEIRRRNDTMHEPIRGLPYSSRSLVQCLDAGAAAFGWASRDPKPGSMRDGEWLIGWGCATSVYPTQIAPAMCRVIVAPDGAVTVETGTHEIGTGATTIIAQTAADQLGVPLDRVTVRLGDSALPAAPLTAGSNSTASVCTVVAKACVAVRTRLARRAAWSSDSPLRGRDPGGLRLRDGRLVGTDGVGEPLAHAVQRVARNRDLVVEMSNNPDGAKPVIGPRLIAKGLAAMVSGMQHKDRVQCAFGAQFVELRIHGQTGEIRVSRLVGAYAAGRIMNSRTAKSQLSGAQVWGVSSALHEATVIDRRTARYVNDDLEEYLIPVSADLPDITTIIVPEEDLLVNPLGAKGLGELGNVGLNAAIANAVFHATGMRIRELPIRLEKLLGSGMMRG